jgi:hypothetical protein
VGVPGSNLGPKVSYPDWGSWFYSAPLGKCWDSALKLCHGRFLLHPFKLIIHLPSFIPRYIVRVTKKRRQITYKLIETAGNNLPAESLPVSNDGICSMDLVMFVILSSLSLEAVALRVKNRRSSKHRVRSAVSDQFARSVQKLCQLVLWGMDWDITGRMANRKG